MTMSVGHRVLGHWVCVVLGSSFFFFDCAGSLLLRGLFSLVVVLGLLIAVAFLVEEYGF